MKKELRKKYVNVRNNVINKTKKDEEILNNLISILKDENNILFYYSIKGEPNIMPLGEVKGKNFYLPYCENNNLVVRKYDKDYLVKDEKGILSSSIETNDQMDVVIAPAIACNYHGYRLGYGSSFYDRFLTKNNNLLKICVCYEQCLITKEFQEKWDIPFDYVVTEKRIIRGNDNV